MVTAADNMKLFQYVIDLSARGQKLSDAHPAPDRGPTPEIAIPHAAALH
jgi:hypothetical protein